jgi:hypothetical protein
MKVVGRLAPLILVGGLGASLLMKGPTPSPAAEVTVPGSDCHMAAPPCPVSLPWISLSVPEEHIEGTFYPPGERVPEIDASDAYDNAWLESQPDGGVADTQEAILATIADGTLIWIVRYEGVCLVPGGPPGVHPDGCAPNHQWNVLLDATTGAYLAGFTDT